MDLFTLLQLVATYGLLSLIWLVQLLSYPLFLRQSPRNWQEVHTFHCKRISLIVIPLMMLEFLTICVLLASAPFSFSNVEVLISFCSLIAWLSTFLIQVPLHNKLKVEFNISLIKKLIHTNWLRTSAWSLKAIILTVGSL